MSVTFDPSDAAVHELAQRILARPEYASWRSSSSPLWLFTWLAELYLTDPFLFWTITGILSLLLVLIVAHVGWTIRRGLATQPDGGPHDAPGNAPSFVDEAARLAERGRYLDASRAVQLGAIQLLVRAERIRLGRGDSNRVLRRQLRDARIDDGLRDDLVASIGSLERCWFRDREENEDLYRRWRQVYGRLTTEVAAS
jgi:hypothetical protein